MAWDFATAREALGWKPTHDLARFGFAAEGLQTRAAGGDPYMVGPAIELEAAAAPHLEIRMRSTKGADGQVFWEAGGKSFNETASQHFAVIADGEWRTYRLDLKEHAAWRGQITRLRLDPSNQEGGEIAVVYIRALGLLPAAVRATSLGPTTAFAAEGQPFDVVAVLVNRGDKPAQDVRVKLETPPALGLVAGQPEATISVLEAGQPVTLTWQLRGAAGVYPISLSHDGRRLQQGLVVVETAATTDNVTLENRKLRLTFPKQPFGYGAGALEWSAGQGWQIAGRLRSLGRIVYRGGDGQEHEALLYANSASLRQAQGKLFDSARQKPAGSAQDASASNYLTFAAKHTDADGATWTSRVAFRLVGDAPWIELAYELTVDRPAQLLAWTGPEYLAGEGSSDALEQTRRISENPAGLRSALFPGLEFLLGDEPSSGADYVDRSVAQRYVPHPNKITIPLMAVTGAGVTTGLMWDPRQRWDGTHDRPAALFASPNSWERQANSLLRLFAPGMTAGLQENHDRLARPYALAATQTLRLTAKLFAAPAADPLAPLDIWLAANGLPDVQPASRTLAAAARLSLENYTAVTWVSAAKGWRYALDDPWGPGSDTAIALHLWISTLGGQQAAGTTKAWRDRVTASLDQPPVGGQPNQWFYQPALLLHLASPPAAFRKLLDDPLATTARQQPDGTWAFTPTSTPPGRPFGQAGDTSNGYVATQAFPVLYAARLTGDPRLREAGLEALAYLEKQPLRPEGAQTWELSLHVPDLLASAWTVQAFIEGYRLTGESRYLDLAQRWAVAGLPFIYLWNAADRPIMRYTTIPVFGASNYTSPWFGRPVLWNGLDYAIGLQGLAVELDAAGVPAALDWRRVAEGITVAAAQMQPAVGSYRGMYPDAWDVVAGAEAYTWWLTPSYLMQNILMLDGNDDVQVHTRIVTVGGRPVHVNTVGRLLSADVQGAALTVKLRYHAGETCAIMFSPLKTAPGRVEVNGKLAPAGTAWSGTGAAWGLEQGMLVVRVPFASDEAAISITLP